MKHIYQILVIFSLMLAAGCQGDTRHEELVQYLDDHALAPDDYVLQKFDDHDYVFIGEYHRIRHDVELILRLIPELQKKGICNLGIEFGDYNDQLLVDSLLALPYFNRELARRIMFHSDPLWGYKEYIDIYKVAWEVNHGKNSKGKCKFRVVNLAPHYDPCKKGGAWKDLNPDVYMAQVIFQEFIDKGEKALIYSGNHHAFTRYHQPLYSFKKDTLYGYTTNRMGNVVYDSLKDKTFNIYLHAAWISDKGWDEPGVLPVNGVIDSVMDAFGNRPVGFDVAGTPFGKLTSDDSYYAIGYPDFTLDQYCDGYIYQSKFKNYRPITMEENFITEDNLRQLKHHLKCIGVSEAWIDSIRVDNANRILFEDIRKHFKHLMK